MSLLRSESLLKNIQSASLLQVKCETKVYHPNIDLEGNVCLNILREDWKPVLTINSIVYGLQYLFLVSRHEWSMSMS